MSRLIDRETLAAAGFTEEPAPELVLIRAERCQYQPEDVIALGLVRVRIRMKSGGWSYDHVPAEAIVAAR